MAKKLIVERNEVPLFELAISAKLTRGMAVAAKHLGYDEVELANTLKAIVDDAIEILDGQLEGLIVSNRDRV